ncbi:MAG: DUF4956 domain-containing protein [FCB group bacterium]|nr:DUF4956 domain-containing protein [FCB group bacterium]
MTKLETFQDFFTTQNIQVEMLGFIVNLLLTALLAYSLGKMYVRFGTSLSNRSMFAKNFLLLATTTMLVITIVKSSLALSLGLVGALSIVRFRAAIKEPEELSYLFFAIAIGLGFGANQRLISIVAFLLIAGMILIRKSANKPSKQQNLHLTVSTVDRSNIEVKNVVSLLEKNCTMVNMVRLDEAKNSLEVSFQLEFANYEKLENTRSALRQLDDSIQISFMDHKGIL